jgi:TonB family protein
MLLYLIYLTLGWTVFASLYWLVLSKETFFEANRLYLLSALVLGLLVPVFQTVFPLFETLPIVGGRRVNLPEMVVGVPAAISGYIYWETWLKTIWMVGILWQFLRTTWGLSKIWKIAHGAQKREKENGVVYYFTDQVILPFSFFNLIFLNPQVGTDSEKAAMIAHEKAHTHGRHTVDILFCELLCIIFWWNPLVYWYKNALRAVHEFIADRKTANQFSVKQYGLLLIQHAQSGPVFALANHFFQSSLKQRIVMLTRNSSSPRQAYKYGLILPALTLFLVCTRPGLSLAQQNTKPIPEQTTNSAQDADSDTGKASLAIPQSDPEYPGGFDALFQYLTEHLKYPESAQKAKAEGTVVISFVVNMKGGVENAVIKEKVHPDIDAEAIRLINGTSWIPGSANAELCIPIKFKLK